ncbi:MAG: hypothetical protein ACYTAS_02465 [Planctomycetota bacterium]
MRNSVCASVVLCVTLSTSVVWGRPKAIHVFVALCDNAHQGIVPVPKQLGNGEDPGNNLYWGALYGTKAFLKRSKDWTVVFTEKKPTDAVLERVIFKHKTGGAYLVADAYRGCEIKRAVQDFLAAAAGENVGRLRRGDGSIGIGGAADLVVYIGHNGLMEFTVAQPRREARAGTKQAMVLACKSKPYFEPLLARLQCRSVLLTTGFMAPEAYTLEAALAGWLAQESGAKIRERAARAYHKYQKCGLKGARRLFYAEE